MTGRSELLATGMPASRRGPGPGSSVRPLMADVGVVAVSEEPNEVVLGHEDDVERPGPLDELGGDEAEVLQAVAPLVPAAHPAAHRLVPR